MFMFRLTLVVGFLLGVFLNFKLLGGLGGLGGFRGFWGMGV